ncbi:hypothetical protein HD806DRAFT_540990 [Xylariaceae sp. AK1471]|nr:hypothetical protein HD806DRAFT_540990 [Xylariaceae sp. AK1471]
MTHEWDFESIRWFIEHGANYGTPSGENRHPPAYKLFWNLGYAFGNPCTPVEDIRWVFRKLLRVRVSDLCSRPRSTTGYTPFKAFLEGWTDPVSRWLLQRSAVGRCIRLIVEFGPVFKKRGNPCGHQARDLRCPRPSPYMCPRPLQTPGGGHRWKQPTTEEDEEIEETNSEQSALIVIFTDFLTKFKTIAYKKDQSGGVPLIIHDPEEFWFGR